jgi:hypothetical protein
VPTYKIGGNSSSSMVESCSGSRVGCKVLRTRHACHYRVTRKCRRFCVYSCPFLRTSSRNCRRRK